MRHDRKGILKELKMLDGIEEKSTMYVYSEDGSVMLGILRRQEKECEKNIVLLTTMHDDVRVTKDKRCKPDSLVLYDHTKKGVDAVNLVLTHNTTRIKHKR